jgi:hypothetical protein
VALNPSRELQERVRKDKLEHLPQSVRQQLPDFTEVDAYERER